MFEEIRKYHRTPHLSGSKLQAGDEGHGQISLAWLKEQYPGCSFVREEKLDGANAGLKFNKDLQMMLQSRGHYLTGGAREAQFGVFKEWAQVQEADLMERLEDRYQMFGEWMFARHTQFYDQLPHLFLEFDIWDSKEQAYLSTPARHRLLEGSAVTSVPVLDGGWPANEKEMRNMIGPSLYRSPDWRENLSKAAEAAGVDPEIALQESGAHRAGPELAEGVYVKIETEEHTVGHFKFVDAGFTQAITESGSHWAARPMIRNRLAEDVDIMALPDRASMEP